MSSEREAQQKDFAKLLSWMTTTLSENVTEVRLPSRLTTSPACIVGDAHDVTPTPQKMYRAMGQAVPKAKRDPRAQPDPSAGQRGRSAYGERKDDLALTETAQLLYGMGLLAEGS